MYCCVRLSGGGFVVKWVGWYFINECIYNMHGCYTMFIKYENNLKSNLNMKNVYGCEPTKAIPFGELFISINLCVTIDWNGNNKLWEFSNWINYMTLFHMYILGGVWKFVIVFSKILQIRQF